MNRSVCLQSRIQNVACGHESTNCLNAHLHYRKSGKKNLVANALCRVKAVKTEGAQPWENICQEHQDWSCVCCINLGETSFHSTSNCNNLQMRFSASIRNAHWVNYTVIGRKAKVIGAFALESQRQLKWGLDRGFFKLCTG